jgi:hypothetical protein
MAVGLSALRAAPPPPPEDAGYSFLLEAESTPGQLYGRKDEVNWKKKSTSSGLKPATFRLVAQCFNEIRYHAPLFTKYEVSIIRHGPHTKHRVQQFFYCCLCIRCSGNVFTDPLPSNVRGTRRPTDTRSHKQQGYLISLLLLVKIIRKVG